MEGDEEMHGVFVGVLVGLVELDDYPLVVLPEETGLLCCYGGDDRLLSISTEITWK